jgi:hypothetical protein
LTQILSSISKPSFIKNAMLPSCINCKYFIENTSLSNDIAYGRCSVFGKKDIITGEVKFDYAIHCREDETRCDSSGIYFVNKSEE